MIYILSILLFQKLYLQQQEICKTSVLSQYGFRGLQFAVNYEDLVPYMPINMCPNLVYSCCGQADFKYAGELWSKNRENLKEYIKAMYKTIQEITVLQSSLLIFKSDNLQTQNKHCRNVDFKFFNSPSNHEEIFNFIPQALKAFGFLQKGFYCMTCDANAQQYLSVRAPTQVLQNIVSDKFCSQAIFFFREYLIYKTFYLDTLYQNVVELGNCINDKEVYTFQRQYQINFNSLQECLYKGLQCEIVCREFQIGQSGSMFLGDLQEYVKLVQIIKEILGQRKGTIEKSEEENEFQQDYEYYKTLTPFFFVNNNQKDLESVRQTTTNVQPQGLNLFEYAITSNFYLEVFSKHQYTDYLDNFNSGDFNDTYNKQIQQKELQEKKEKGKQLPYSSQNSFIKAEEQNRSDEEQESQDERNSQQPETVNQVRQTHKIHESVQQDNASSGYRDSEIKKQEDLVAKEIDEKLRENSSYNIKQEVGSNKNSSNMMIQSIGLFFVLILTSFN